MGEVSTTVRIDDPDVQKQVKVQKRGSIHLAKDLAGERVEVVAKRVDTAPDPDAQAVDSAISSLMAALDADDIGEMEVDVRAALTQLDSAAE